MKNNMIKISSAVTSNYDGMVALVDVNNKVYLGKKENYHFGPKIEAYYDNKDNSLCFISNNPKIFSFLYGTGWVLSQTEMLEHGFNMNLYNEFDELQNGVLKQFIKNTEIYFKDKPFIPPSKLKKLDQENISSIQEEEEDIL